MTDNDGGASNDESAVLQEIRTVIGGLSDLSIRLIDLSTRFGHLEDTVDDLSNKFQQQLDDAVGDLSKRLDRFQRDIDLMRADAAIDVQARLSYLDRPRRDIDRPPTQTIPESNGHSADPSRRKPAPFRWG